MNRRVLMMALLFAPGLCAYSVLTHEALVDSVWEDGIKPALLKKYPRSSDEEIRKAYAFAYGGAIVQDLGYYPLGSKYFSDLVHYVRAGDFIENMLADAQNLNEYAFALGALAHDAADNCGHPIGTNRAVPLVYPKLRSKFGDRITYADHPASHLKVEFGFDVVQVAHGHYAPESYHNFIGFDVSKPLLERAFRKTYGIELKSVFLSVDLALGTYRWSVSQLIPEMTRVAWEIRKDDISRPPQDRVQRTFVYHVSRASYEKDWGREYKRPGFFARFLAFMFRIIPRVGPFRALSFRPPGPEAQKYFMESFNAAVARYRENLGVIRSGRTLDIPNENFDTGEPAHLGSYKLADKAVAKLVQDLAKNDTVVDDQLRTALKRFFDGRPPQDPKIAAAWRRVVSAN